MLSDCKSNDAGQSVFVRTFQRTRKCPSPSVFVRDKRKESVLSVHFLEEEKDDSSEFGKKGADLPQMRPVDGGRGCLALGSSQRGYVVYVQDGSLSLPVEPGRYALYTIDRATGAVKLRHSATRLSGVFGMSDAHEGDVYWLQKR